MLVVFLHSKIVTSSVTKFTPNSPPLRRCTFSVVVIVFCTFENYHFLQSLHAWGISKGWGIRPLQPPPDCATLNWIHDAYSWQAWPHFILLKHLSYSKFCWSNKLPVCSFQTLNPKWEEEFIFRVWCFNSYHCSCFRAAIKWFPEISNEYRRLMLWYWDEIHWSYFYYSLRMIFYQGVFRQSFLNSYQQEMLILSLCVAPWVFCV